MHYPLRLLLSAPPSVRLQPETSAYIAAVEAQDGQALEPAVVTALDAFVVGCKQDNTWNAIKASCILAGARTLSGALVPLVGTAPTNFNFVTADYNRKTGLVGNGSTKYLDSNRNNNADPQNSNHNAVYVSTSATGNPHLYCGAGGGSTGATNLGIFSGQGFSRNRCATNTLHGAASAVGLFATSRSNATDYTVRQANINLTTNRPSEPAFAGNVFVFAENAGTRFNCNARLAFYSIGESLDLALLDARVTTLINAIAAAIP